MPRHSDRHQGSKGKGGLFEIELTENGSVNPVSAALLLPNNEDVLAYARDAQKDSIPITLGKPSKGKVWMPGGQHWKDFMLERKRAGEALKAPPVGQVLQVKEVSSGKLAIELSSDRPASSSRYYLPNNPTVLAYLKEAQSSAASIALTAPDNGKKNPVRMPSGQHWKDFKQKHADAEHTKQASVAQGPSMPSNLMSQPGRNRSVGLGLG